MLLNLHLFRRFLFALVLVGNVHFLAAQNFTQSNLPIILIDTDNVPIQDEPKTPGGMKIIDNGSGQVNRVTDPANDYDGAIAIEIRGQTSSFLSDKKPYGFETRDSNGEDKSVSLLGMPKEVDWILLAPFSDKSLLRDVMAFNLAEKFTDMKYTPRTRLVEVVLNGDYVGVYVLTEKIKRDGDRVDIEKNIIGGDISGGYILKIDKGNGVGNESWDSHVPPNNTTAGQGIRFLYHYPKPDEITPDQMGYIQNYMYTAEEALRGSNYADPVNGYRKYMEINSFIDFMLLNEVTRNVDGYRISTFFYKDRDDKDSRLHMGPVWDFNITLGNANYCEGGNSAGWAWDFNKVCSDDYWSIPFWWDRLRQDTNYLIATRDRWKALRTTTLSDLAINSMIDSLQNLLSGGPADRNFQRWPILGQPIWPNNYVGNTWQEEMNFLRTWTIDRVHWMDGGIDGLYTATGTYDYLQAFNPRVVPNPASGNEIHFEFYMRYREDVTVRIFDIQGKFVGEFTTNATRNGIHTHTWQHNLHQGVYTYRADVGRKGAYSGKVVIH